ncbi:SGNH/GDSL hydrolase family protein [Alphaproteobacteria bacterium]|nr:SGNH/GDSL hydrolase family protein [Alphaproteobacteria bacterium]
MINLFSSIFLFFHAPSIVQTSPKNFIKKNKWVAQSNWKIIDGVVKGKNASGLVYQNVSLLKNHPYAFIASVKVIKGNIRFSFGNPLIKEEVFSKTGEIRFEGKFLSGSDPYFYVKGENFHGEIKNIKLVSINEAREIVLKDRMPTKAIDIIKMHYKLDNLDSYRFVDRDAKNTFGVDYLLAFFEPTYRLIRSIFENKMVQEEQLIDAKWSQLDLENYKNKSYTKELWDNIHTSYARDYRPFIGWRRLPKSSRYVNINKEGFRLHPNIKDEKSTSVGFFGGSTMWGYGARDVGTIPAFVDSFGSQYVTFNFGETGYNSRQNLEQFINLLNLGKKFDFVVFYDGANDVANCTSSISKNTHLAEIEMRKKMDNIQVGAKTSCAFDTRRAEEISDIMISNWKHARTLAINNEIEFIAILQPTFFTGADLKYHPNVNDSALKNEFKAVYPLLRKKIAALGVDWIVDLSQTLDVHKNEYIFIDWAHMSENGNCYIAKEIAKILDNRMKKGTNSFPKC